jgi:hypothetical protein
MESPEELEKALARLMPAAISTRGRESMEDLLDALAGGEADAVAQIPPPAPRRWIWWSGGAAAAAAVVLALNLPQAGPAVVAATGPAAMPAADELVLVGQTEVVEEAVPEDWMSESNGVPHRAWRVRVLDRERLRDVATGHEVIVTRPREEIRLIPVTSF